MAMKMGAVLAVALIGFTVVNGLGDYDWSPVDKVLEEHIAAKVFPGCVAAVANAEGTLYMKAFGSFTYGNPDPVSGTNPPMTIDARFDLASLTKVTATTSAAALLYQWGVLGLHTPVATYLGEEYNSNGKSPITPLNLLLHNAGYPPDPVPDYWNPEFGCPATSMEHPPETFDCSARIWASLLNQTLINPVGTKYVYSDLSMITLMYVVGTIVEKHGYVMASDLNPNCADGAPGGGELRACYYEAFVRVKVFEHLNMSVTGFLPPKSVWEDVVPTWDDTTYRHRTIQGQVSDENSYALGGIAGHAGVFSTAPDLLKLLNRIMFSERAGPDFLNATTVKLFTTMYNETQSSRALGWDTNSYVANTYRGCADLSTLTYTHLGYTGTQMCNDPTRNLMTILLTNRVYPNKTGNFHTIHTARQAYNTAVLSVYES